MSLDSLAVGMVLPEYQRSATPPTVPAENRIHGDEVAQKLGFKAGLVPGVTVYAWMTHPVVAALGAEWLERGAFSVRFNKPVYYGELATIRARVAERTDDSVTIEVSALNPAGESCATATMGLELGSDPKPPDLAAYPEAPLPAERPVVSRQLLETIEVLGTPELDLNEATAHGFLSLVDESLPLYAGARAPVHPAIYLNQANRAVDRNVQVSPWLHLESRGRHLGGCQLGERLSTRGKVKQLFERKGHEFIEVDLLLVASGGRPVASIFHTAIYQLRQPA
ncbi:MAG: hypothetical protein ACE5JN_15985 [Candidatus Methylomirabilia bacterium]